MTEPVTPLVIKIGGSVLTGRRAYARASRWLAGRVFGPPIVVVVSAEQGVTDRLLAEAEAIGMPADPRARDLLLATGELQAAARLALHLQADGIPACALNVHEAGLSVEEGGPPRVAAGALRRALEAHAVVVVPGFLGTRDGAIVTLGRGGSDLTAVALAAALGAAECELIKDVPGYFTADPAASHDARHLPSLDFATALRMADDGCELVQAAALRAARDAALPLVITTAAAGSRATTVRDSFQEGTPNAICHTYDSRRAAVGA